MLRRAERLPTPSDLVIVSEAGTEKGTTEFRITPPLLAEDNYYGYIGGDVTGDYDIGDESPEGTFVLNICTYPADFTEVEGDVITVFEEDSDSRICRMGTIALADLHFNTEKFTEEELEAMTKADILDLGFALCLNMTTTMSNTKAEIIADFLACQG